MGSFGDTVSALQYLRSRSDVDCDCLDTGLAGRLGQFVDCTSNQADSYLELMNAQNDTLFKASIVLAQIWQSDYTGVPYKELAFEIAMVKLSLNMVPSISGSICVMSNPLLGNSSKDIIENSKRIASLCHKLDPTFDVSRLCIKVVATWEGLQACRALKQLGIRTLATTLFTFEQAVLAAEVGCASISPFLHELKAFFDETYQDNEPSFELCRRIQHYYKLHACTTRVKVAGLLNVDQAILLAGAQSITIAPNVLEDLANVHQLRQQMLERSIFREDLAAATIAASEDKGMLEEKLSFVDDEAKWRTAFSKNDGGKGQLKMNQAIEIFCDYQLKGEALIEEKKKTLPKQDMDDIRRDLESQYGHLSNGIS